MAKIKKENDVQNTEELEVEKKIEEIEETDSSYTMTLDYDALREGFFSLKKDFEEEMASYKTDEEFEDGFISKLETYFLLASQNDIVCQDFMCYLYKIGVRDILPRNYDKFFKWAMFAISNGNRFTIDRFRLYLNNVFDLLEDRDEFSDFYNKGILDDDFSYEQLSILIADEICSIKNVTIDSLLKEGFVAENIDEDKYKRDLERMNPKVVDALIKRLETFNPANNKEISKEEQEDKNE